MRLKYSTLQSRASSIDHFTSLNIINNSRLRLIPIRKKNKLTFICSLFLFFRKDLAIQGSSYFINPTHVPHNYRMSHIANCENKIPKTTRTNSKKDGSGRRYSQRDKFVQVWTSSRIVYVVQVAKRLPNFKNPPTGFDKN